MAVVALTKSLSVTDDRAAAADRTLPRQKLQWNHPGSMLSFASGSAIKRITAGVKARRRPFPVKASICRAFTLRQSQFRTKEKEYCFASVGAIPSPKTLAGLKGLYDH
jgi:hypothetical protein